MAQRNRVGIVMLNYNGSRLLDLTMNSLVRAQNDTEWVLYVVDNGSKLEDTELARQAFERQMKHAPKVEAHFLATGENKGFSGGNNVALREMLKDKSISHFCLLNSDVIVTHHWLDYMIHDGLDVVGPVTNAAGNEQTISIDFTPKQDESAFELVQEYGNFRHEAYKGCYVESSIVTFFNTIFTRKVVEKIGLLDERFFPGSFEDDDYCIRIIKAGFKLWVIRDCYIHHWGSGSFSNLSMDSRIHISQDNKARLEEKWNMKWEDRRWKLLESFRQDMEHLRKTNCKNLRAWSLVSRSIEDSESMIRSFVDVERWCDHQTGEVNRLTGVANERLQEIENLNKVIKHLQSTMHTADSPGEVDRLNQVVREKDVENQRLDGVIIEKNAEIDRINGVVRDKDHEIDRVNNVLLAREREIKVITQALASVNDPQNLTRLLLEMETQYKNKCDEASQLWIIVNNCEKKIEEKTRSLTRAECALNERSNELYMLTNQVAEKDAKIGKLLSGEELLAIRILLKEIVVKIRRGFTKEYWRGKLSNTSIVTRKKQKDASEFLIEQLNKEIDAAFAKVKATLENTICVIAPIFDESNIRDGYFQRIKAIDEEILTKKVKVYINLEAHEKAASVEVRDDMHIVVYLNPGIPEQAKVWQRLVKKCSLVYVHSCLRLMTDKMSAKVRNVLTGCNVRMIWDIHGSVPEEFALYHDYYGAQIAGESEEFLIKNSSLAIAVNNATREHLQKKYGKECKAEIVVMPIFNADLMQKINCKGDKILKKNEKPLVVYAGGLQRWQKIDLMQDVIEAAGDICRYNMFVPQPDDFMEMWGNRTKPTSMFVGSRSPEQLKTDYRFCHYGFVLRDDVTVNNVACPTKIIEYIQFGIIPVMDTTRIGDFIQLGMQYVDYHDLMNGKLPSEHERLSMANKNYKVLEKLVRTYVNGRELVQNKLK